MISQPITVLPSQVRILNYHVHMGTLRHQRGWDLVKVTLESVTVLVLIPSVNHKFIRPPCSHVFPSGHPVVPVLETSGNQAAATNALDITFQRKQREKERTCCFGPPEEHADSQKGQKLHCE